MALVRPVTVRLPPGLRRRVDEFDAGTEQLFDRIRGNPVADRVFYGASELGNHSLIWVLLAAVRGLRAEDEWPAVRRAWTAIALESALVNLGIKSLFRRKRPVWEAERPLRLRVPLTSSFPSGHATSAFTAAALLSEGDRLAPVYYSVAAVVAASRIHVRIHHASDVVAGVAVGVVLGEAFRRLFPLPPASAK